MIDLTQVPNLDQGTVESNAIAIVAKADPRDKIQVEIGDTKQDEFYPQLKVMRWDNEVNFSARLVHDETDPKVSVDGDRVIWDGERVSINWYSLTEGEGGHEFAVILKERPKSNVLQFTLQTKGLEFLYQPPLTEDEIKEGCVRPDEIVGSYAVYYVDCPVNTASGNLYRCGKVGHIKRPKVTDAAGKWVWEDLKIDVEAAMLSIVIPQGFLDNAQYPVVSRGVNFGYQTAGGSSDHDTGLGLTKAFGTPPGDGTVTSLSIFAYGPFNPNDKFNPAIYADSAGSPGARLAYADSGGSVLPYPAGWCSSDLSLAITAGTQYWLGDMNNYSAQYVFYNYDTGSANDHRMKAGTTWPDPWPGGDTATDHRVSIYATYTEGGGGGISIPVVYDYYLRRRSA